MLAPGVAQKVTIHMNEDTSAGHDFLYNEVFALLKNRGVAGATLFRPVAGFGSHHRTHSIEGSDGDREHLPVRIEFIESHDVVAAVMPELCDLVNDGLIEVQDTRIIKTAVGAL